MSWCDPPIARPRRRRKDARRIGTWRKRNNIRGRVQAADHNRRRTEA